MSDSLRVTMYGSPRSEADPEVISCPQPMQTQCPKPWQPGKPTVATALALMASLGSFNLVSQFALGR